MSPPFFPGSIPGYPPGGLRAPPPGERVMYPASGESFAATTGQSIDSLYLFNEASGDLIDVVGSDDLLVANTPTFDHVVKGRRGIYYDAASDRHGADVHATGAGPFWVGFVGCFITDPAANVYMIGRRSTSGGAAAGGWQCSDVMSSNGIPLFIVRDGTNTVTVSLAGLDLRTLLGVPLLFQAQRDNEDAKWRARVSGTPSGAFSGEASSAALGDCDVASMLYNVGSGNGQGGDEFWCGYHWIQKGAGANGTALLADTAHALGWE